MNGSRFRAGMLLGFVFVAGAAAGIAGDRLQLIPQPAVATEPAEPVTEDDEERDQAVIQRFADDLGLTAVQRGRIDELLDRYRHSTRQLSRSVRPQYRALMDSVKTEIEGLLNETQLEQYRALLAERYGRNDSDRGDDDRDRRGDGDRNGREDGDRADGEGRGR